MYRNTIKFFYIIKVFFNMLYLKEIPYFAQRFEEITHPQTRTFNHLLTNEKAV